MASYKHKSRALVGASFPQPPRPPRPLPRIHKEAVVLATK